MKDEKLFKRARALIESYMKREFESNEDFEFPDDISKINLAYTSTENDEEFDITAELDLINFKIETKVDGVVVRTEQYESLNDIVENGLNNLEFNELTYVSDEDLLPFYVKKFLPDVQDLLDEPLEDDATPFGGVSFQGETLRDFLENYEIKDIREMTLASLNKDLEKSGILPIKRRDS